jgi:hypothetical protein
MKRVPSPVSGITLLGLFSEGALAHRAISVLSVAGSVLAASLDTNHAEACSLASWTGPLRSLARPKSVDRPLSALYPGGAEPSVDQSWCGLEGQELPRKSGASPQQFS